MGKGPVKVSKQPVNLAPTPHSLRVTLPAVPQQRHESTLPGFELAERSLGKSTETPPRELIIAGKSIRTTPVFNTYWRFAAKRQALFMRRARGLPPPWTDDSILATHRFTNAYRASDRVSQFLIRHVLYEGKQTGDEIFFRCLLFKIFNRISTWAELTAALGTPTWKSFDPERYSSILDKAMARGNSIYSAAYIMPSPRLGYKRKHRNHLRLLEKMMRDGAPRKVEQASSLSEVFNILKNYPSFGSFLAFQYAIDLNYSRMLDFSEMDFVVAGPGALEGIQKCFVNGATLNPESVIQAMTQKAPEEFQRLGLNFEDLWGRPLQLIDCQNLFCEVGKYARVAHPEFKSDSGRVRIKQKYSLNHEPLQLSYPPKWKLHLSMPPHSMKVEKASC